VTLKTPPLMDNIRLQEPAVMTQPGDANSSAVRSWELDDHGRAGWQLDRVVPRGETSETPDPILQRGPPNLVVISHRGEVCEEHLRLCGEHWYDSLDGRLAVPSTNRIFRTVKFYTSVKILAFGAQNITKD